MPEDREIIATLPAAAGDLAFAAMSGSDEISRCFKFDLTLVSEDPDITAASLLSEPVTIEAGTSEQTRYFHGLVTGFAFEKFEDDFAYYRATLRPWLWLLSKQMDCRIFQNKSVVEIIEEVFSAYPQAHFEKRLQGSYDPREYCVQYDESDLDFVQRLMEHEGIFYFFEYEDGAHLLVMTDSNSNCEPAPGFEEVIYQTDNVSTSHDMDYISDWRPVCEVNSGIFSHTDYDFMRPTADLMSRSEEKMAYGLPKGDNEIASDFDEKEQYRHPGSHLVLDRGDKIAAIRREEAQAGSVRVTAKGPVRGLLAGCVFDFDGFPRQAENGSYLVVSVSYQMWDAQYRSGTEREGNGFLVSLLAAPAQVPFRPARHTVRPIMRGPQTATVVGPAGEEIYTDEYSRVKVQFHWDRLGARDENSSCFVRVSSVWAGAAWGFIQIPRIGQEVIVDFIEGDPDKPIITGRVYNADQMPPYDLPANATQSGWKSNTSPGGGGFNEMRFEDKAGQEEVYFQAQKDHNELVKNDESRLIQHDMFERVDNNSEQSIGVDRTEEVGHDKSTKVVNNRKVDIGVDDTETVGNNRSLDVGGDETIHVTGSSSESIDVNHSQTVGLGQKILVKGGRLDQVGLAELRTILGLQSLTVGARREVKVGSKQVHYIASNDKYEVKGNQDTIVHKNHTTKVTGDQFTEVDGSQGNHSKGKRIVQVDNDQTHEIAGNVWINSGKEVTLQAADSITLKTGKSTIKLEKNGTITLEGEKLILDSAGKIFIKAADDITMVGSKIHQN